MTTRTFKQQGQAYGSTTATILASINGVEVYSGSALTLDEPLPSLPDSGWSCSNSLYTWETDLAFAGTQTLSIQVTGGTLLLTDSTANYCQIPDPSNPGNLISSGVSGFSNFYQYKSTANVAIPDPLSNVQIDGVLQARDDTTEGQWYWTIPAGSTLTATINVSAGVE